MESWASLNVLFVGVWQEDFSLELSTIELPWQVIHDIVLPPFGSANIPDIGLFVLAPLHRIFIQSHYHNLLECSQRAAFPKGLRMPENAPCCVLEVLQPSAVWQFALVSRSLPVPSVLNIRQAAKQHNVVQLTCSSHNLAPVCCTIHMVNLSPFSHSSTCPLFSFFLFFDYQTLSDRHNSFLLHCHSFPLFLFSPGGPFQRSAFFLVHSLSQVISGHIFGPLTSCGSKKSFVCWLSKLFGWCLFHWGIYSAQRFVWGSREWRISQNRVNKMQENHDFSNMLKSWHGNELLESLFFPPTQTCIRKGQS